MNIHELDSYDLGDAVKFNDKLNPRIWGADEKMRPEVREQLLKIADDFREFLGIDVEVKDITVSGSNAAYTYTPHSDIDLHLVVDLPWADESEVYRELFDAKKYAYNDQHDIRIGGYDVELYVQDANKPHHSQGIYSVMNDDWVSVPKRRKPDMDDISVKSKFEDLGHRIEDAIKSQDYEKISELATKLKDYRQAGLDAHGEFGPENLAFKILRTQGLIKKLYDAGNAAKDRLLSLDERKKKRKKKVRYGYGGYWYPGTAYAGQDHPAGSEGGGGGDGGGESVREDAGMTWDGVNPTTDMFTSEDATMTWDGVNPSTAMFTTETKEKSAEEILREFIKFCVKQLGIAEMPRVKLRRDPQWPAVHKTFGRYNDEAETLEVAWGQRHIMDVLRTVAHELTHKSQHEREDVPVSAGETGSAYENEANAQAGILMRDWGRLHPEHFDHGQVQDLEEAASGYIPTRAQAKDPRYSMALTVDIKPGQVGKEANKLKLKTDRQGHPQIARANGLFEHLMAEYQQFKEFALDLYEAEQNFAIASQPIPGDKFKLTINNRPFILTPGGFGKQHSQVFLDSFYLTDMKSGKTEFVDSWWNWPMAKAIADHLDQNHADALVNIGKADFAWHEKNNDWDSQPPRLQGIRRQTSVGIPAKDFVKSVDAVKRVTGQDRDLNEDEDLDEVKMSPGALEKFASSDAAKGIRAGFEAELIFRDTQGEADELDPEPNYDADERAYSIQQVIDFFDNDEYGFGMNDRQRNQLEEALDEKYMEWRDEQIISDFRNDAEDLIRDILLAETPMDQRIHFYLTDSLQMSDEEADAVIKAGAEAPKFTNSTAQKDYADENPEYKAYLEAADEAEQELEESVEFSVNRQDEYWDEALDEYRDTYMGDDDSFFSDVGLRWMSDIANEFNLDWPVWDMDAGRNDGSRDWEEIGSSLQDAVDMPVKVSSGYHTTTRREGQWIIEPDGSLDPDDKSEEVGLEIVSPPMPLLTAIEKLRQVVDWANDPNGGNAYTNSSTGLHMGVSLPTMKSEAVSDDIGIDYVKLILFLGDKYVQQQFGREANTYCASALEKLKQNIKGKKSDPAGVVKLLQHGLTELAYKELQKGVGTSKYTSAHIQPGYIEFRSPGGDWLAKADEEIGVLENTMLRFARAMAIAGDPNAERQEYAKKLYKLVTEDNPEYADQLKLFSEFSAGTINKEQLKKQWADTVLQKELPSVGKDEYEVYRRDKGDSPDATVGTLYAKNYDDAYDQFLRQYGRDINDLDVRIKQPWFDVFDDKGRVVKTLRAKDIDKATERAQYDFGERWTDAWNIYRKPDDTPEPKASPRAQVAKRIAQPKPEPVALQNYEVVDRRDANLRVIGRFQAKTDQDAGEKYSLWLKINNLPDDTDAYGYRRSAQDRDARKDSADLQRNLGVQDVEPNIAQNFEPQQSNWEIYQSDDPSRVVNTLIDATERQVQDWLRRQETQGMPPGFLSARRQAATESIDPISGTGAVQSRSVITKKSTTAKVQPVEPAVKKQAYRSAIGQAISQQDLENMTRQIQTARKLGDSVMEMEDTPPEVLRALDQAAQKNGYKNWADVKANPKSESAVMNVAKLANTILRTTGPHHEKVFYKSKTDENFADGKVSGKSRPGRVKRAGASCKGSVTDLRARAKKYGGEKGRMYHWCANMKSGRKK